MKKSAAARWLLLLLLAGGMIIPRPVAAADTTTLIDAWRNWKSIDAAIALEPLDGPEDIREKAEIIADRLDELQREAMRLARESEQDEQIIRSLRNQRDILRDLAELRHGNAAQAPQQLHELTDRIVQQEQLAKRRKDSLRDLGEVMNHLQRLLEEYKHKADALQQKEGAVP